MSKAQSAPSGAIDAHRPRSLPSRIVAVPLSWLGHAYLRANGWRLEPQLPDAPKYVLISAPHTSAVDMLIFLMARLALKLDFYWMGATKFFWPPVRPLLRMLGGIEVDQSGGQDTVTRVAEQFASRQTMVLGLNPEGSRKRRECWRSGFYHIAMKAGVPIAFGYIDYAKKTVGCGGSLKPSGDIQADMEIIAAFYEGITPRYPQNATPFRVRAQLTASADLPGDRDGSPDGDPSSAGRASGGSD